MVNYNDAPFRGPPVGFGASGDAEGSSTGKIYSFQSTSPGTYRYSTSTLSAGRHPYYSYPGLTLSLPFSFHDGEVGLGQVMTVSYPSYLGQGQEPPQMQLTRQEGPFVIRTTDRFALNTTIAQWTSPNPSGLENYVQLQTGTYNGMIRNCWHFFLPNLVRQACYLWDSNEALRHLGYYIVDDSGSGLGKSIRKFELLFSSLSPPAPAPAPDNPAPTIRTQPTIASNGSTQVGTVLTRVPGAYGGTGNDYSGQWSRTRDGVSSDIPGAQQATYTLQPADVGYTVRFNEIVVNASGRVVGSSAAYGPVTAAPTAAPTVQTAPRITANGGPQVGTTLLRVEGVYTNGARGVRGIWYRVDSSSGVTPTGEGRATYTLKPADVGYSIMFQEIAANAAGQEVAGHSGLYGPVSP